MEACRLCRQPAVEDLLDFGPQPISNRYLVSADEPEYRHRLALGVCRRCGLVQLIDPAPAAELAPRVDWITYNEPEGHLDSLADIIAGLPGLTPDSVFVGVSGKDESTLRRLQARGFSRTWQIDPAADLGIPQVNPGVEAIQARLNAEVARGLVKTRGRADVVLARHILEHAHDLHGFLGGLRGLLQPAGFVVFEMPDARRALEKRDYSTVWEEHLCYFTPETLLHSLRFTNLSLGHFDIFPYALENSLVAIVQPASKRPVFPSGAALRPELERAFTFAQAYGPERDRHGRFCREQCCRRGPIAVFGAGHLACAFVNLLGLSEHIDFVVDDNAHKQGLLMPGSRLPILGSAALLERSVRLCLLTVAPESEEKVLQKQQRFLERGGQVASIFPDSRHALHHRADFQQWSSGGADACPAA